MTTEGPTDNGAEFVQEGNRATASIVDGRIKTPEQLIAYIGLDMTVWEVERAVVNKWEVGAKDKRTQQIFVEPLWQVKLWLVKIKPEPLEPVITPVVLSEIFRGLPNVSRRSRKMGLLIFDPQFGFRRDLRTNDLDPFHDRAALSIVMQVAAHYRPDFVGWGGDLIDLPDWSDKFVRSPEMYFTTQPAIVEAAWIIGNINRMAGKTVAIAGNHDDRMYKAMVSHFVQAYDLRPADRLNEPPPMTIDALLGLDRMGIEYIGDYPNGRYYITDDLALIHGDKVSQVAGATSKKVLSNSQISVIYGHIHRREMVTKTIWRNGDHRSVTAMCPGCVCRIDGAVPGSKIDQDWQQGFAIIYYDDDGHQIVPVEINKGTAYIGDRYFEAQDYTKQLYELDYFKQQRL